MSVDFFSRQTAMHTKLMAGALLGALLLNGQAMAATSATGSLTEARLTLTDLSYKLQDLRVHDGVDPLLRWDSAWALNASADEATQAGWLAGLPAWGDAGQRTVSALAPEVDLGAQSLLGSGESHVWVSGTGLQVMDVHAQSLEGRQASAGAGYTQAFTLGAGTQVSFSVLMDAHLQGGAFAGGWTPPADVGDPSHASASYAAVMSVNRLSSAMSGYADNSFVNDPDSFETRLQLQGLTLTVSNTGLSARTYLFGLTAYVQAEAALSPVPEPGGMALWLAGLSLLPWCVSRQRRGRAFS